MFNTKEINSRFLSLFSDMTQAELAAEFAIGQSAVSSWATFKKQVPWEKLAYAVAKKGVSWDWLLAGGDLAPSRRSGASPARRRLAAVALAHSVGLRLDIFLRLRFPNRVDLAGRSEAFGYSGDEVLSWIEGRDCIPEPAIRRLQLLGCNLDWLYEGTIDAMPPPPSLAEGAGGDMVTGVLFSCLSIQQAVSELTLAICRNPALLTDPNIVHGLKETIKGCLDQISTFQARLQPPQRRIRS